MATFYRPYIHPSDYPAFTAIADLELPRLYPAWQIQRELSERQLRRSGHRTVSVAVKPEEFLSYCRERRLRPDSVALHAFAQYSGRGATAARDRDIQPIPVVAPAVQARLGGRPITR
jgi:hypothetical protein